jgi:hypothetical protein
MTGGTLAQFAAPAYWCRIPLTQQEFAKSIPNRFRSAYRQCAPGRSADIPKIKNFIHHNTNALQNPYTKVYTNSPIDGCFSCFSVKDSRAHPLNARHLPGLQMKPSKDIQLSQIVLGLALMENRETNIKGMETNP